MIMEGCQGKPRTPTILDKTCPQCGHEIEMFSTDTEMRCEHCGFTVYNVGDEMYETMMKIAAKQKEEAAAARRKKQEGE